jgi:GAF domain-containing protein
MTLAVPMFGFGVMDNLVMIQAGEAIDASIGVTFGLATMTSAAMGQIVSDVSGTLSGGAVEAMATRLGLPHAGLTRAQLGLRQVKVSGTVGAAVGVGCGCIVGMSCLLFMDLDKAERLKKKAELRTLYATLMEEGHKQIGAEHCALFLLDEPFDPKAGPRRAGEGEGGGGGEEGLNRGILLTSLGWKGKEPTKQELDRTFKEIDVDQSGKVSSLELYQALTHLLTNLLTHLLTHLLTLTFSRICHYAPRTTHHAPRTTHHALRTTHYSLLTTRQALRTQGWTAELGDVEAMIQAVCDSNSKSSGGSGGHSSKGEGKGEGEGARQEGARFFKPTAFSGRRRGDGQPPTIELSRDEFGEIMRRCIQAEEVRLRVRPGGSRHHVITTGQTLNVRNVRIDPRIDDESRRRYLLRGYEVLSLLLAPIKDSEGRVVALVELVNKVEL